MDRMKDTIARLADQRARDVRRSRAVSRASAADSGDPRATASRPPAATPPAASPATSPATDVPAASRRVVQRSAAPTLPPVRRPTPPPAIRTARSGERRTAASQPLRPPIPADALDTDTAGDTPVEDRILE